LGEEGMREGRWILMDYADVVIHIFYDQVRSYYDLEGLWIEAPRINPPEGKD
jgi:ribosome-associated protein